MRPARLSMAVLMATMPLVAITVVALRDPSELWASVYFTAMLAALAVATLAGLVRDGEGRIFWIGFALFGWGYATLCFGPWFHSEVAYHLLTTKLLDLVFLMTDRVNFLAYYGARPNYLRSYYFRMSHSMMAIALAFVGGMTARILYAHGRPGAGR